MSSSDVARLVFGYLSEQGLKQTKDAFTKESPDLLGTDTDNDMDKGQKLSLIIEEYFLLKKIDRRGKSANPESVLLLLWKQFDVLVGQLKHTTIYNSEKEKSKAKRTSDQKARVRELNKQNWQALQQKNKSLAAANRNTLPKQTSGTVNSLVIRQPLTNPLCSSQPFITPRCSSQSLITPQCPSQPVITPQCSSQPVVTPQCSSQPLIILQCSSQPLSPPQCPSQPLNMQCISFTPNFRQPVPLTPAYNMSSRLPVSKTRSKTVTPSKTARVKVLSENVQEINSSERLQCSSDQSLLAEQSKSPKRKSVLPKKRTGDIVSAIPATQISKLNAGPSTQTSNQDDLDIQSIVDKILHRPELPEKLAESINRAVEFDASSDQQSSDVNTKEDGSTQTQQCPPQQNAVVNSNKVDDIMEMMKSDPVFEELFSCFENFESGCEESETGQIKENESRNSPKQSLASSQTNEPATEALDALLLLASSPVGCLMETSCSLETPQKSNGDAVLSSPRVPFASPVPVMLSPGNFEAKRQSQPIMSHIRQLNFTGINETSTTCSNNKPPETATGIKHTVSNQFSVESRKEQVSEKVATPDKKTSPRNITGEQSFVNVPKPEGTRATDSQFENPEIESTGGNGGKRKEDVEITIVEGKNEIEQAVGDISAILQKEQRESNRCTNTTGKSTVVVNVFDTDEFSGREERECFQDSPLKLSALEDLATNELLQCKSVKPAETKTSHSKVPNEVTARSVLKKEHEEGCERAAETMFCQCEPIEAKGISTATMDYTTTEVSEGCTSLTEGCASNVGRFTNIKSPESNKTPPAGQDLSSSTESNKLQDQKPSIRFTIPAVPTSKRKKKKKSKTISKKAKIIPEDLDVDKFLSQLHYAQEKT